jgi:hypothetical protein
MAVKRLKRTGITVKVPPDVFERLDRKRYEEKTTLQDVGAALFQRWLSGEEPSPSKFDGISPEEKHMLAEYLSFIRDAEEKKGPGAIPWISKAVRGLMEILETFPNQQPH